MHHLAIYNFNNFRVRSDEPINQSFHDRNDLNFRAAEVSKGFIARSGYEGEDGPGSWGPQVYPRFYIDNGDGWAPSSLSLWRDLPSLFAFSYSGIHVEAMRNALHWFDRHTWPPYVLWWVPEGHFPDWREGVDRLEHLHVHGPSAAAFDFKWPFDPFGNVTSVNRAEVQRLMAENAAGQARLTVRQL